ncbi:NADH dehydrogenase I, 24 kda subunit, chain E [Taylorella asinigenitalis 14/45]|uniref:NADH dehydrogenase I, 24 kDa subunit, chain E n=1 Tax=Taylorella asinigenitalis 14/45 TaxID=1091495 RepID=I7JM06_9BURK|nr:NADH-quinone oxidoreductase subunit NuoE [Taylorella asinigenitalis]CCG19313.1 NADH dehydrogenase I, 24 kda subunit, chain E [Taylorella asinigenitalis 14/45]
MLLSEKAYELIDAELKKYPEDQRQSAVMSALRIAQTELNWVSPEVVEDIATYLGMPVMAVQEVATFYNMYELQPVGKYKITVCTNLPCALREGVQTINYLQEKLGIGIDETSQDGLITIKAGECMGACGDSPVLLINNHHMCVRMDKARIDELLEDIYKEEGVEPKFKNATVSDEEHVDPSSNEAPSGSPNIAKVNPSETMTSGLRPTDSGESA